MDSGVIWFILAVLGAALIVGGTVAYRGSTTVGVRALGAAFVAAGVAMWGVALVTLPASASDDGAPPPTIDLRMPSD